MIDACGVHGGVRMLVRRNVGVRSSGWLPRGLWPELDALAETHDAAVADLATARRDAGELGKRFKAEDEQRVKAYETGLEVPQMTDPAERQAAVTDAKAKLDAAERNLTAAVVAAVEGVQAHLEDWQESLKYVTAKLRPSAPKPPGCLNGPRSSLPG